VIEVSARIPNCASQLLEYQKTILRAAWRACLCLLCFVSFGWAADAFRVGGAYADITPTNGMPNYNGDPLVPDKDASPLRVEALVLD